MKKIKTLKIRYPGRLFDDFTKMIRVNYDPKNDDCTVFIDVDIYNAFCAFIKEVVSEGEIVS